MARVLQQYIFISTLLSCSVRCTFSTSTSLVVEDVEEQRACRREIFSFENVSSLGFEFSWGFESAVPLPHVESAKDEATILAGEVKRLTARSTYVCDTQSFSQSSQLLHLQLRTAPPLFSSFHADDLLTLLWNKTFVCYGDSLGLQYFHMLDFDTFHFASKNKTLSKESYSPFKSDITTTQFFDAGEYYHAERFYPDYNASIHFCKNPYWAIFPPLRDKSNEGNCSEELLANADYILVMVGAWYKPPNSVMGNLTDILRDAGQRFREVCNLYHNW